MLPKSSRIPRKSFASLLKSSKFFHSEHFLLRTGKTSETKPQFGVSVSKKISKKAVTRNTIRRRVYAVLSKKIKNIKPISALLIAKPGAEEIQGAHLQAEIEKLLKISKLIA